MYIYMQVGNLCTCACVQHATHNDVKCLNVLYCFASQSFTEKVEVFKCLGCLWKKRPLPVMYLFWSTDLQSSVDLSMTDNLDVPQVCSLYGREYVCAHMVLHVLWSTLNLLNVDLGTCRTMYVTDKKPVYWLFVCYIHT